MFNFPLCLCYVRSPSALSRDSISKIPQIISPFKVLIEGSQISIKILDFYNSRFSRKWMECIDKEWLEELEQKEREIGKWLE